MPNSLFDTHAHLDADQLAEITESVVATAEETNVKRILTVSTTLASCYQSIKLAEQYEGVFAAVGIHPNSCQDANPAQWKEIRGLVDHPKVVAIGETGLDDHWDFCPMSLQKEYFQRHIQLSHEKDMPFIVHMRDCEETMMEFLAQSLNDDGQLNGLMHSFCGSQDAAKQCLDWGMYISFAGMVTYKKNAELREIARSIPDERLLIETDSPYLSPHPFRGTRPNTPAMVRHTLDCLAESRETTSGELAKITTENALRIFKIDV